MAFGKRRKIILCSWRLTTPQQNICISFQIKQLVNSFKTTIHFSDSQLFHSDPLKVNLRSQTHILTQPLSAANSPCTSTPTSSSPIVTSSFHALRPKSPPFRSTESNTCFVHFLSRLTQQEG